MTLKTMLDKLITRPELAESERSAFRLALAIAGTSPVEGLLTDDLATVVQSRYEWFFHPDGRLRGRFQ